MRRAAIESAPVGGMGRAALVRVGGSWIRIR